MARIAVIGLGGMGGRIARRLLDSGYELRVWNRTPERASELLSLGALAAETPAEAAGRADALITMVSDPAALQAVTEGRAGVASGVSGATTVIDMSTVGPAAIKRLAGALPAGTGLLDAPVLGSFAEAETGKLHVFVGGPAELFERWRPLFSVLGTPLHAGALGSGAAAKLVANSTLFGTLGLLGEALALARAFGLSQETALAVLAATPLAAQAKRRRPQLETGDFPVRFPISLARKDADLIAAAAAAAGLELHVAGAARAWIAEADAAGWGERDYASVLSWILRFR